jgi:hypothetical protein
MQGLTPYVVAFAAGLGALIGGGHGAILAATIILGLVLIVSLIGAVSLAKQQKELTEQAQADLAALLDDGGSEWGGVPTADSNGIPPLTDREQAKLPEDGFDQTS